MTRLALPQSNLSEAERSLLDAAVSGDTGAVVALLQDGIDVDVGDEQGFSPLMLAARQGHVATMKVLVEAGAAVDLRRGGSDEWPPLMNALHKQRSGAALALLEWGADPNARGDSGFSALMMASGTGDLEVVEALLQSGADPRARLFLGFTALDYAIGYGHATIVRRLLGEAPDLKDRHDGARRAVILLARAMGRQEILALVQ